MSIKEPEQIAKHITEIIAQESFKLFQDKKLRKLTNFEEIDQTEQDRIFNEIVVTGISLAILMFETLAKMASGSVKQHYLELQIETASRYSNWLKEMGTPQDLADIWKELIKLRTDEYRKDYEEYKDQIGSPWQTNPWLFVVAIGGFHHITRGKGKPSDELFKIVIQWMNEIGERVGKIIMNQ